MFSPRLSIVIPKPVADVCMRLHQSGYQAYVVGGAVRDTILRRPVGDWDVTTDASPDHVCELFARVVPTGVKYGTVTVINDGLPIEVTTMRKDGRYLDGRRPEAVAYTNSITEDLARRDFTVNAIAYSPVADQIVDPFRGIRDAHRRRLRTVGKPQVRFQEDGLRVMRLIRFVSTLGFHPARRTLDAIDPAVLRPVSRERIGTELSKLMVGTSIRPALGHLHGRGVLAELIPELIEGQGHRQGDMHRCDVLQHNLEAAACIAPRLHLRLAALLHDVAKPRCRIVDDTGVHFYGHDAEGAELASDVLRRLRFDSKTIDQTAHLVRWHMFSLHYLSSDKAVRRFVSKIGKDAVSDLLELRRADIAAAARDMNQALQFWTRLKNRVDEVMAVDSAFSLKDLAIDGRQLMAITGVGPGPQVGVLLNQLLDHVLDEPSLNTKEQLEELALRLAQDCKR